MKNSRKYELFYWSIKKSEQIILNYNHKFKSHLSCEKQMHSF